MKKKSEKKEMKEKKKSKQIVKKVFLGLLCVVLIFIAWVAIQIFSPSDSEKNVIKATKKESYGEEQIDIEYIIEIKDYNISKIEKNIEFNNKKQAEDKYQIYEAINLYERKNIGLELKGKKLKLTMPEDEFKKEIGYSDEKNTIFVSSEGEKREIVDQDELKNALRMQGYTVK